VGNLKDVVARNRAARRRDVRKAAYILGLFGLIILVIALYECTTVFEPNLPARAKPAPTQRLDGVRLGAPHH
jgi:hypothetical protein